MTATTIPRNPVVYMTTVEKLLGRSMTTLEAGEIYRAWLKAVPMEEIAARIKERGA